MKLKTLALMGICATMAISSCKKDDDDKKEETTTTAASVEGTWKMTAQTLTMSSGGQTETEDMYADLEACEKDDLTRLSADKKVTHLAGATKCDPSDPDSEAGGTWSLSADGKKLTLDDGGPEVYDVVLLDSKTCKLRISDTDMGVTYTMNMTLARQ